MINRKMFCKFGSRAMEPTTFRSGLDLTTVDVIYEISYDNFMTILR